MLQFAGLGAQVRELKIALLSWKLLSVFLATTSYRPGAGDSKKAQLLLALRPSQESTASNDHPDKPEEHKDGSLSEITKRATVFQEFILGQKRVPPIEWVRGQ